MRGVPRARPTALPTGTDVVQKIAVQVSPYQLMNDSRQALVAVPTEAVERGKPVPVVLGP